MIERVISGGQTGADQAALLAARSAGIPTGGTAARLWLTEDGPAPWLADYGLVEFAEPDTEPPVDRSGPDWNRWVATVWPPRTRANVLAADATLWFGDYHSHGGRLPLLALRRGIAGVDATRIRHAEPLGLRQGQTTKD